MAVARIGLRARELLHFARDLLGPVGRGARDTPVGPSADDPDAIYEKWVRWFKQIANETHTLFLYRDYWRGLGDMTQANGDIPPSTFFDALGVWYSATQATSVRRQLDRDPRSVSLANLLADIAAHPEVMTRERHVALWNKDRHWEREGHKNYDRFAGDGNDQIAPERTQADLDRLNAAAKPIRTFVNKAIAHTDEEERDSAPTYKELNDAIEVIGELLEKYSSLLTATMIGSLTPVHQQDWRKAFTVAWLG